MGLRLNHTIVWCRDRERSSSFFTELFGRPPATEFGSFRMVCNSSGWRPEAGRLSVLN